MNWKGAQLRRRVSFLLSRAALVCGLLSLFPWSYYYENLPHSPQPAVRRVYPVNMHGVTKYATREERRRLNLSEDAFFGCVAVFFLAGFLIIDQLGQRTDAKLKWPPP